ncbi:MAG TPA: hypothetical protein VMH41_01005 [Mycobacteriales bacterium]|nr:hypothetical protein [Mycobacteriales bacterium]
MSLETKWVLGLSAFCAVLLVVGTIVARSLSTAPPRVIRVVWPVVALITFACYAILIYLARTHVKG